MRKRGLLLATVCILMAGMLSGCGAGSGEEESQALLNFASENKSSASAVEDGAGTNSQTEIDDTGTTGKTLVVYFSATGNTERVAKMIAETTGGELFKLEPADPYTEEDLEYNNNDSRVSRERADESLQDIELTADTVEDWQSVSTVFIGFPIWWGGPAWPVNGFIEANDFTGKTVIPFCTSGGSGIGDSGRQLAELAGSGNWLEGERFSSSVSQEDVKAWIESFQ